MVDFFFLDSVGFSFPLCTSFRITSFVLRGILVLQDVFPVSEWL